MSYIQEVYQAMSDFEIKRNNNAIDTLIALTVQELATKENCDPEKLLPEFLASKTARILYDESTKLWWDGPSAVADMYREEPESESVFKKCRNEID